MSRLHTVLAAVVAAALLSIGIPLSAWAADSPDGEEEQEGPPVEAVEVPYLGEADITVAAPWQVVGCPPAPPGLEVTCESDRVTLTSGAYDAGWGEHVLVVALSAPIGVVEVRYRVILAPPEAPAVEQLLLDLPVPSGAQVLVPIALFGAECVLCTSGVAELEVGDIDPPAAGFATASGTHIALRTTAGFRGDAVVPVRLRDDAGQTAEFEVAFRVSPAPAQPFGGLHVFVPIGADGTATVDLADLGWPAPAAAGSAFRCSTPVTGTVLCADGVATYAVAAPAAEAVPDAAEDLSFDQFVVRIIDPAGRIALASVTLVPPAADWPLAGIERILAPVAVTADPTALLRVAVAPPPDEGAGGAVSGPLSGLDALFGIGTSEDDRIARQGGGG